MLTDHGITEPRRVRAMLLKVQPGGLGERAEQKDAALIVRSVIGFSC